MIKNENNLKDYDSVSEDIKYISNSMIRLKILMSLNDKPQNMKELTQTTGLSYSSISASLHDLELGDMLYYFCNKYYLCNSTKLLLNNILELKTIVNLLDNFFNITNNHVIDNIPEKSVLELNLLEQAHLIQSSDVDVFKIYNFIESILDNANSARCILPVFHSSFNRKLNELSNQDKFVEIMVSYDVSRVYREESTVKYLSSFEEENNFLLIITNEMMVFGLFKSDGKFDQNRLIASTSKDALKWANNLFRYFKQSHK